MDDGRTDEELMIAYAQGEAAAFDLLYSRHRAPLYRFVQRALNDDAVAQELFQDIWLKLIDARERYAPSAKFTTWLYRIAHNRIVDEYRRRGRSGHTLTFEAEIAAPEFDEPETISITDESQKQFRAALSELPELQREVFLFRHDQGFDIDEIARITDVNPETAKSRLRYAVRKLKAALTVQQGAAA